MEYNLSICQKAIADNFPSLDIKDAAIIDFSTRFSKSSKIQKKIEGQSVYYWFDYGKIASENPLLKLNSEAIRKRIRHLCELGIFDAHPLNRGGKVFFSFGANYEKTHKFDEKEREENPDVVKTAKRTGRKSRPQREENPDLLQKEREENPDNHNNHLNNHKNQEHKNQNNAALPLSEYPKAEDIYPETFSLEAQQPEPTSPGGGAIRVSITGPEHPDITVQDVIEPQTEPPAKSRGKAKTPRSGTQEEIELATRVIEHLNQTAGRSFRVNTGENARGIIARHREGFSETELMQVVEFKAGKWKADPEMYEYLNPVTLFRPANFERYLQAARAIAPKPQQQTTRSSIQHFGNGDYSKKQAF